MLVLIKCELPAEDAAWLKECAELSEHSRAREAGRMISHMRTLLQSIPPSLGQRKAREIDNPDDDPLF